MLRSYPKVYNLGHRAIADLLLDPVTVQEKVDGSQFSFGFIDGKLQARSRGAQVDLDNPPKFFAPAVETVKRLHEEGKLFGGQTYRGEAFCRPKHNVLAYDRVPNGNIMLFDVDMGTESYLPWLLLEGEAKRLGLEVVPTTHVGKFETLEQFEAMLDRESILGGQKIEGIVIKNYTRFGIDGKALMGKHVSEKYREIHGKDWKLRNPGGKDIKLQITEKLRTEARWLKAVQHLQDREELLNEPKDIGPLLKEINKDVLEEESEAIREMLFRWAWKDIARGMTRGFAQWYKERLVKRQFEGIGNE